MRLSPIPARAISVPATFEAEDFAVGGEGVGYHDNTAGNQGGQYRLSEDVDIIVSADSLADGYVVNNFETGEWLAYAINVAASGNYDIELRASSMFASSAFHVEIDGTDVTGVITVPNTGGWSTFQWVGTRGVALTAGLHVLKIVANQQSFDLNSVRVVTATAADTTAPTVSVTSPASGATVSGTITVTASASDNVGVVGVQFYSNGAALGAEDTTAPYSVSANTTTVANGSYTLTAVARDAAGNRTTSAPRTVTVSNTAADTTPPTVSVTSPASGATVSGTVNVTASASDNVGVLGVQFYSNGTALGAEDTTAPYSVSVNTTTVANGSYSLTAVARDAAGNRTFLRRSA